MVMTASHVLAEVIRSVSSGVLLPLELMNTGPSAVPIINVKSVRSVSSTAAARADHGSLGVASVPVGRERLGAEGGRRVGLRLLGVVAA
jgi:hypothetical protein